ncbi:hypothetical protein BD560DRAFT_416249 [Blakeslea trispora]|nr:hypothetical protein BD560DRAFT_416249 [Blakeslea trispora]
MTQDGFPNGYFYIISKMNGLAIDIDTTEPPKAGTKLVTATKKESKPERDTQLWIHQNGFLTNKFSGLVMDIGRSKKFIDIFTGSLHLYVDVMKEEESANDQRFGYDHENGYIYTLFETNQVLDIRKKEVEEGATIMLYEKNEVIEEGINQLWDLQLADPPKVIDSSDDEEDDGKRARFSAWFGSWFGWDNKKKDVLQERDLEKAHEKVYKKNKSHLSYEIIAGAVAVQAVKMYLDQQEANGEEVHFKGAKEIIAGFAAKEMVKMFMERGTDDDDEDDDEEQREKKQGLLQKMATSAAVNYFDTKYTKS